MKMTTCQCWLRLSSLKFLPKRRSYDQPPPKFYIPLSPTVKGFTNHVLIFVNLTKHFLKIIQFIQVRVFILNISELSSPRRLELNI